MANFILLVFCFAAGIVLRRLRQLPDATPAVLNAYLINLGLPAMALGYLHGIEISAALILSAAMPWAMFALGVAILWPVTIALKMPRRTAGCVILVGSLANTSFVGLPMIEAFYGPEWMSVGIVIDQLGSYVVLSILGIATARVFSEGPRPAMRDIALKILRFPPFLATVLAVALTPVVFPFWLDELFIRIAGTVAPLALISVGFQLRLSEVRGKLTALTLALGYKLVLGPLLILLTYTGIAGGSGTLAQVTVFETAMAPMIGAVIVAMDNDLDPPLATLLVGIGVPLSFATLTLWHWALVAV